MQHSVKTTNPHKNYAELLESKLAKLEASCSDITDERAEFETDNDGYDPGVPEERKEPRRRAATGPIDLDLVDDGAYDSHSDPESGGSECDDEASTSTPSDEIIDKAVSSRKKWERKAKMRSTGTSRLSRTYKQFKDYREEDKRLLNLSFLDDHSKDKSDDSDATPSLKNGVNAIELPSDEIPVPTYVMEEQAHDVQESIDVHIFSDNDNDSEGTDSICSDVMSSLLTGDSLSTNVSFEEPEAAAIAMPSVETVVPPPSSSKTLCKESTSEGEVVLDLSYFLACQPNVEEDGSPLSSSATPRSEGNQIFKSRRSVQPYIKRAASSTGIFRNPQPQRQGIPKREVMINGNEGDPSGPLYRTDCGYNSDSLAGTTASVEEPQFNSSSSTMNNQANPRSCSIGSLKNNDAASTKLNSKTERIPEVTRFGKNKNVIAHQQQRLLKDKIKLVESDESTANATESSLEDYPLSARNKYKLIRESMEESSKGRSSKTTVRGRLIAERTALFDPYKAPVVSRGKLITERTALFDQHVAKHQENT